MKRAQFDVADEVLANVEPLIRDHGLTIVSTRPGDSDFHKYTRFTVEGDVLPDFCEGASPLVRIICTQAEVEGVRRIWISAVEPVGINGAVAA